MSTKAETVCNKNMNIHEENAISMFMQHPKKTTDAYGNEIMMSTYPNIKEPTIMMEDPDPRWQRLLNSFQCGLLPTIGNGRLWAPSVLRLLNFGSLNR